MIILVRRSGYCTEVAVSCSHLGGKENLEKRGNGGEDAEQCGIRVQSTSFHTEKLEDEENGASDRALLLFPLPSSFSSSLGQTNGQPDKETESESPEQR